MFARQTGKTFSTTLEIVLDCLSKKSRWVILSRGERQARECIEEGIKSHLQALKVLHNYYSLNSLNNTKLKVLEVVFFNGSRITALPANPDTARGFSANVFLDEFAFHQDSKKIWAALFPVISKRNLKLRVVSTPNGKNNKFYDLMTGDLSLWSRHIVDIYKAVNDGLPLNIEELKAGLNDLDSWEQEYELKWRDEVTAWLDYDLIIAAEDKNAGLPVMYTGECCYLGVDIAIRGDYFVAIVIERVCDVFWIREIVSQRRISFASQAAEIDRLMRSYHISKIAMDQTGMGEMPVESAIRKYGDAVVEGVFFTAANKLDIATRLKKYMQNKRLRIPIDFDLREDLHAVEKHITPTGMSALRADRNSKGHADRFWALALAVAAGDTGEEYFEYTPIKKRMSMNNIW